MTGISSDQVDKRHWTCRDLFRTPFNNLFVNDDLIRFARDKNSTTCVCLRCFPSDEELCLDLRRRLASIQWLAPSEFLALMRSYEAMLHNPLMLTHAHFIFNRFPEIWCFRNSSKFLTTSKTIARMTPRWPQTLPRHSGPLCQTIATGIRMAMKNMSMWIKMPGRCRSLGDFENRTRWLLIRTYMSLMLIALLATPTNSTN